MTFCKQNDIFCVIIASYSYEN